MDEIREAFEQAVKEYNRTVLGRAPDAHRKDTYEELRGMFYNSLRRAFNWRVGNGRFMDEVPVWRLSCTFRKDNSIEKFNIEASSTWNISEDVVKFLKELKSHCNRTYLVTESHINFDNIRNFNFKP